MSPKRIEYRATWRFLSWAILPGNFSSPGRNFLNHYFRVRRPDFRDYLICIRNRLRGLLSHNKPTSLELQPG
ncbi:hypothetical protein BP354E_3051 [Burkholderia pseudomallei 354e]|nr:hypothetical protein BP354E_3051 [Burkholderia pseudomallei 354e]EIF78916.1 hypothetical protein BP354A_3832 [Burkholderia pseudomallei 354a]